MNQRLLKNGENINSQDITLFCFPFAGGGASTYTSWIKKLKDKITVCPIQLPGREERIMEKPYTDMSELLRDLTDEIVIAIKGKYALWGHSMGGKIAYELEKYLENKGYQAQCIFASGCRIPNIPEPNPIGFTFGDDADYISMETSQTFRLLGEKYGKILNKLGYSNYILIGHCVGGLIALETAQYLQKKNVQVSDVTLISSNIPKQKNQTILSQATDEIYRKTLQSSLDNEILLERIFAKLIGADAYKAGYQVDEERLQQYIEYIVDQGTGDITVEALCNTGGKFEDVAKEFRLLASKSVSERLNALYNIIERPNGELMEHQLKMLNILFRVFSQNIRCVST